MFAPIATLLLAGLVAADSSVTTTTKVDINQFSNLYNGPYSSAMHSYAAYLADNGFNASYISTVLNAYNYGTNTMDQTSYIQFLSDNAAQEKSIASVRATQSFSFAKQSITDSDEVPNTASGAASATEEDGDNSKATTGANESGSSSKASGSGSGSGSSSKASGSGSGSSNSTGSESSSSKGNGANFVAPIGAAIGAVAIALL